MSIGKLALAAMTVFGLAIGIHEGIRLAGGLAAIVIAQILLFGGAIYTVVRLARNDAAAHAEPSEQETVAGDDAASRNPP